MPELALALASYTTPWDTTAEIGASIFISRFVSLR